MAKIKKKVLPGKEHPDIDDLSDHNTENSLNRPKSKGELETDSVMENDFNILSEAGDKEDLERGDLENKVSNDES